MINEAGVAEKIIAVPVAKLTQRYDHVKNFDDLPEIAGDRSNIS